MYSLVLIGKDTFFGVFVFNDLRISVGEGIFVRIFSVLITFAVNMF